MATDTDPTGKQPDLAATDPTVGLVAPADASGRAAPPQGASPPLPPPRPRLQTAPGVGPAVGGIGPDPSVAPREVTPVMAPRRSEAVTLEEIPAAAVPRVAVLLEGTPVPPEATEALLTGLLKDENESYFRKAKPASESSGEAAVAYAAGPHVVSRGNPDPPPQPAVMLRRSLELDIAGGPATPPPPVAAPSPSPSPSPPPASLPPHSPQPPQPPQPPLQAADRLRATAPTEMTMPLVVPLKGAWVDRWLAFVLAAALAGLVGVGMVHWLSPATPAAPSPAPSTTASGAHPTATTPSVTRPPAPSTATAGLPIGTAPPASAAPAPTAPNNDPAADDPAATHAVRPGAGSAQPGASAPPPKSDVKRAL